MKKQPPDPIHVFKGNMDPVHSVCFHITPEEELILAGTQSGLVHIWDLQKNEVIRILEHSKSSCISIHIVGNFLVTQDKEGVIKIWTLSVLSTAPRIIASCERNISFCRIDVVYNDSDTVIITSIAGNHIELYSSEGCKMNRLVNNNSFGTVMTLKGIIILDGQHDHLYILATYENGLLVLWDSVTGEIESSLQITTETHMAMDYYERYGICGTNADKIHVFTLNELTLTKGVDITMSFAGVNSLKIRNDGKIFAAACWDHKIRIFSRKSKKLLVVLECHTESVLDLCFSKHEVRSWDSGLLLAGGGLDKRISLWDIYNQKSQ